jgi:RNA ligase (TIGR02306 family)
MPKNASIEQIVSVEPHPGADRLDLVKVLGFQCVCQRGLYTAGDVIVYIQSDSVLPEEVWTIEYRKYSPTRIKACKIRNFWSEGIIVPFGALPDECATRFTSLEVGTDVSEVLGVTHYEPTPPNDLSAKGALPLGIPKTDEERWENMVARLPFGETVDVTLKVDGQSWSAYFNVQTGHFGVCGRTMEYKEDSFNAYTAQLKRYGIRHKLIAYCLEHNVSLCIRGESYGPGIQKFDHNPHTKGEPGLAIFGVWLIDERRRAGKDDPHYFRKACHEMSLPMVPVVESDVVLTEELIQKYSVELKTIDGKPFEGVVINHGEYAKPQPARSYTDAEGNEVQIEPFIKTFVAGSFKVINKNYDAKK